MGHAMVLRPLPRRAGGVIATRARTPLATDSDKAKLNWQMCSRIDTPISTHLGNPLLYIYVRIVVSQLQNARSWNLTEAMRNYMEALLARDPSPAAVETIHTWLPKISKAMITNEWPLISNESEEDRRSKACRFGLLKQLDGRRLDFAHELVADYFLAVQIAKDWGMAGPDAVKSYLPSGVFASENRWSNVFRMLTVLLRDDDRERFLKFVASNSECLAHHCLLELQPEEYEGSSVAATVRSSLEGRLKVAAEAGDLDRARDYARALSFRDPRIHDFRHVLKGLVPVARPGSPSGDELLVGRFPVTNLEYLYFIDSDGYEKERYWSPAGWKWCRENAVGSPAFWFNNALNRPNQPVVGVSFYEAYAFCRWLSEVLTSSERRPIHVRLLNDVQWWESFGEEPSNLAALFCRLLQPPLVNRPRDPESVISPASAPDTPALAILGSPVPTTPDLDSTSDQVRTAKGLPNA